MSKSEDRWDPSHKEPTCEGIYIIHNPRISFIENIIILSVISAIIGLIAHLLA